MIVLLLLAANGPTGATGPRGADAPWLGLQCSPTQLLTGATTAGLSCVELSQFPLQPIRRHASIPVPAFQGNVLRPIIEIGAEYAYKTTASNEQLWAALTLPSGAVLQTLQCVVEDNEAAMNMTMNVRDYGGGASSTPCAGPFSTANASASRQLLSATDLSGCATPAGTHMYSVVVAPSGTGTELRLLGCFYSYDITSVLP